MPSPALVLWVDSVRAALVSDWQSTLDTQPLTLRQGDNVGIELHWVKRSNSSGSIMDEVPWPSACNITMAIGRLDAAPTAGTFTLSYDGDETIPLNYNATAQEVEDALNTLGGIITDGGVTVSKVTTTYRIIWNDVGVPSSTLVIGSNDLVPTCSAAIGSARAGSPSVKQVYQVHIKQAPAAVQTVWVDQDATTATITQTHAPAYSGDYRIWRLVISPSPKGGSFRLGGTVNGVVNWTYPIAISSLSANTISAAIGINVIRISQYEFEISQSQATGDTTNVTAIAVDGTGLIGFSSKYGVLSLNTMEMELLLAGAASAQAVLEVEVELDGARQTIVQTGVTIVNDLIDTDSYTLTAWGEVMPVNSVVRFDTSQSLSTPQKTQARTNIGALGSSDLTSTTSAVNDHESRLTILEGQTISTDQRAAITGANTPSATNVFSTATDLATKAALSHTHTIANVTGLQTALDTLTTGKISVGATFPTSQIVGLDTALTNINGDIANKADISHTHADLPNANQKSALNNSDSPTALNPYVTVSYLEDNGGMPTTQSTGVTGAYNSTNYPYEIKVTIGGVTYAMPARIV